MVFKHLFHYAGNIAFDNPCISAKVLYENVWRSHFCSIYIGGFDDFVRTHKTASIYIISNKNAKHNYPVYYMTFVSSSFSENLSFSLIIGFLSTSPTISDSIRNTESLMRSAQ